MLHITRDFLTLPNMYQPTCSFYLLALFCRRVLNYTLIGQTNFDLDGALTLGSGNAGAIGAGTDFVNLFTPDGYTVSINDVNRILVIHSATYPLANSGLWRVLAVNTSTNQFVLGLRGAPPIVESGLQWSLHPPENTVTFSNGANGTAGEYQGRTTATTSRCILQSPNASAWQVRFTYETATDVSANVNQPFTVAPGTGGDAAGDFPVGGTHLHASLWFNSSSASLKGGCCGFPTTSTGQSRLYLWGDDSTGSVVAVARFVDILHNGNIVAWGLPEDEEYPNDDVVARRVFVYGNSNTSYDDIVWKTGFSQTYGHTLTALGYSGQPIKGAVSTYCYASGQQTANFDGPRFNSNASDSTFIGVTELQTVDVLGGTWDFADYAGGPPTFVLEPRRLGRFPIARLGRSNYGDWTTSTPDSVRAWLHTRNGVYLPWYGNILP